MRPIGILIMLFVLLVFGIVGTCDFKNELEETETYCQMVRDGHWPDYKGNYREVCE